MELTLREKLDEEAAKKKASPLTRLKEWPCRSILTVRRLKKDGATNLSEVEEHLDVVKAVGEVVKDAGPTYLHHVEHWSAAELPANITNEMETLYGQVGTGHGVLLCTSIRCLVLQ
jgi:hypothetical protein